MDAPRRGAQPRDELPRGPRRPGSGRGRALLRGAFWVAIVLLPFLLVVQRQTRAVERERELRALEQDLAVAEAERLEQVDEVQRLSTRQRVVRDARDRLGLHLPADHEIVLLPLPADGGGAAAEDGP
jgi:hypothetical protein